MKGEDRERASILGTRARGVEDLHGVEPGLLGNTVGGTTDGTGNVGAVAVAVRVRAVDKVGGKGGAAAKVGVRGVDTRVNDVRASAGAGAGVVGVARAAAAVRDAADAPGSTGLGGVGVDVDNGVLLNELDLWLRVREAAGRLCICVPQNTHIRVVLESLDGGGIQSGGEALEALRLVLELSLALEGAQGVVEASRRDALVKLDNVLALDDLNVARNVEGSRGGPLGRGSQCQGHKRQDGSDAHVDETRRSR